MYLCSAFFHGSMSSIFQMKICCTFLIYISYYLSTCIWFKQSKQTPLNSAKWGLRASSMHRLVNVMADILLPWCFVTNWDVSTYIQVQDVICRMIKATG